MITCLMADHFLAVLLRRIHLKEEMWVRFEPHVRIGGVPYDFRFYALLLLGALTAWRGIGCVRPAVPLANRDISGWQLAVRTGLTAAGALDLCPIFPHAPGMGRKISGAPRTNSACCSGVSIRFP
jgi:hypothetical protein